MKTIALAKIQAEFPDILTGIEDGEEVLISSSENQQAVAVIVPYEMWQKTKKRVLGTLQHRGSVAFADDFTMTDEVIAE